MPTKGPIDPVSCINCHHIAHGKRKCYECPCEVLYVKPGVKLPDYGPQPTAAGEGEAVPERDFAAEAEAIKKLHPKEHDYQCSWCGAKPPKALPSADSQAFAEAPVAPEPQQPKTEPTLDELIDLIQPHKSPLIDFQKQRLREAIRTERVSVFTEYKRFKPRDCPTCGKQMKAWPSVQGVWTDTCPTCDVFRPAELKGENQ